ncbi:MAG: hypothetical protein ACAI35_16515 [Candidatus Methylacidiphilales bacterium]
MDLYTIFLAETPWWMGLLVAIFMVISYFYTSYVEYQAKKQEEAEFEARKRAEAQNPRTPAPYPAPTVVINRDLSDALGRRGQGDVLHLPTPPPRRRIEPSPSQSPTYTPPPRRGPPPPPVSSVPPPIPVSTAPERPFPGAGSRAGSQTEALSRNAGPTTTLSGQSSAAPSTSVQPAMILTELDRLTAQNAASAATAFGGPRALPPASAPRASQAPSASPSGSGLAALMRDKNALRQAFVLKEVLGTPRGLSSDLY